MTVTKTRFTGLLLSPARNRGLAFTQLRAGSLRQSGPFWRNLVVQKNERITPNATTARRTNPQRFISRLGPFFSPIQSSNQAVSFHLKYTPQTRVSHNFSQDRYKLVLLYQRSFQNPLFALPDRRDKNDRSKKD